MALVLLPLQKFSVSMILVLRVGNGVVFSGMMFIYSFMKISLLVQVLLGGAGVLMMMVNACVPV